MLVDAAGRLAAEAFAPVLPDAAGKLALGAGVQALEAAAGMLADAGLASLLDAAAELSAVSGMLLACSAAAWVLPGASGGATAPLSAGFCDAAVPVFAAAAAGQEDCTCSAVQPWILSCTLMSLYTCRVLPSGQHSRCKLCYYCMYLAAGISLHALSGEELPDGLGYSRVSFMICKVRP